MVKKIIEFNCDISVLCGIILALRFIYTKDIYMQVGGYTVNILVSLIDTIVLVWFCRRQLDKRTSEKTKLHG